MRNSVGSAPRTLAANAARQRSAVRTLRNFYTGALPLRDAPKAHEAGQRDAADVKSHDVPLSSPDSFLKFFDAFFEVSDVPVHRLNEAHSVSALPQLAFCLVSVTQRFVCRFYGYLLNFFHFVVIERHNLRE